MSSSIRIISVPPGEAPLPIREAWVGLELPLFRKRVGSYIGSGVLSGPKSILESFAHLVTGRLTVHKGFLVPVLAAIEILEVANPAAARWWRENPSHMIRKRRYLLFPTECCEVVT